MSPAGAPDGETVVWYRFGGPIIFSPGATVCRALEIDPPPVAESGWYVFLLRLDDAEKTVIARTEVYFKQ